MLVWSISGYVAAMATLVMSFRIERTSRDAIRRFFEKIHKSALNILFWSITGYVAAMATLVLSFHIERTSRDVIRRIFVKIPKSDKTCYFGAFQGMWLPRLS